MSRQAKILPLFIAALAAIIALAIYWGGLFRGFDYLLQDLLMPARGASPEIVIVTIDDQSISDIGQWPWPRSVYAKLLDSLSASPPKAVGIDVLFAEASRLGSSDDATFARALGSINYPLVLATEGESVTPLAEFTRDKTKVSTGDVHLIVDLDGVVRRANLTNSFASKLVPSTYNLETVPRIAYAGLPGTFRRVSFARVLSEPAARQELAGKIVVVGATATDLHDEQLTPLSRGQAMPGVEIQANITNMILTESYPRNLGNFGVILLALLSALVPALCFRLFYGELRPILSSLAFGFVGLIALVLFFDQGFIVPVFCPILAWFLSTLGQILYRYFGAERGKREMRALFGKYLSPDILGELLSNPSQVKLGGEEREVTVLFSDVRGFTTLSESMSATALTKFLNRYLTLMTDVIINHKGVVNKYIGDAIMAFWGAPVLRADHALSAVASAVAQAEALDIFNNEGGPGVSKIEIGIGLNTGPAMAGNMGSEQRFSYTLMGDTVNLASRLEGLTKYYRVRVIASATTLAACPVAELKRLGIAARELDKVTVKGKALPVTIFEICRGEYGKKVEGLKSEFDKGRELYYAGKWREASEIFKGILARVGDDGPTKLLLERSQHFIETPPKEWQGVYEHTSK